MSVRGRNSVLPEHRAMLYAGFKNFTGIVQGKGDKAPTRASQQQCTVLAQYCLPTLHSKPRMVQNLSQCRSIHRYNIQQWADQVLGLC